MLLTRLQLPAATSLAVQSLMHTHVKLRCSRHGHGLHVISPLLPKVYRTEFIARWRELELDVVLCPVLGPAFTTGYPGKLLSESGTFLGGQSTTVVETGQRPVINLCKQMETDVDEVI